MLDLCEGSAEAKIFLYHDDNLGGTDCEVDTVLPPRINHALPLRFKSFVLHDYCQQFARDVFYGNTSLKNKNKGLASLLQQLLCLTLGFPFISICHILLQTGIGGPPRFCRDP